MCESRQSAQPHYIGSRCSFLREQAEKGDVNAQWLLAGRYAAGSGGVSQDGVGVANWYRRAAEQGNATSQLMLGVLYFGGVGVPKDMGLAYMWLIIAEMHGGEVPVEFRNQVMDQMTPAQIAEAEKLARAWSPR